MNIAQTIDTHVIKKAYFHEYSDGRQVLKIFDIWNGLEVIELSNLEASLKRTTRREIAEYCLLFGFQHDTFPIDNRTEADLKKEWEKAITTSYQYNLPAPGTFEEWKAKQVLSF